jgi:hypothetical protein
VRWAVLLAAALLATGCGAKKAQLAFAPVPVPVYPEASTGRVTPSGTFETTVWTLPRGATATQVYAWYVTHLPADGWHVTQRNETGIHAEHGARTLDLGVRGRTLEANEG